MVGDGESLAELNRQVKIFRVLKIVASYLQNRTRKFSKVKIKNKNKNKNKKKIKKKNTRKKNEIFF